MISVFYRKHFSRFCFTWKDSSEAGLSEACSFYIFGLKLNFTLTAVVTQPDLMQLIKAIVRLLVHVIFTQWQ